MKTSPCITRVGRFARRLLQKLQDKNHQIARLEQTIMARERTIKDFRNELRRYRAGYADKDYARMELRCTIAIEERVLNGPHGNEAIERAIEELRHGIRKRADG